MKFFSTIDITAVVKVTADAAPRAKVKATNTFMIFLEVRSIHSGLQSQSDKTQMDFTLLDLKAVQEIFSLGAY